MNALFREFVRPPRPAAHSPLPWPAARPLEPLQVLEKLHECPGNTNVTEVTIISEAESPGNARAAKAG
jgi:hypothetical protein